MDNHCHTQQREIMPKVRKAELLFLYATHHLVPFYISTKYHKNIPKSLTYKLVLKSMDSHWQIEITPKVRKSCHSCCHSSSGPVLHMSSYIR